MTSRYVRLPLCASLIVASVVALWLATAPRAEAVTVQICHKKVLTVSVIFGSLDYRRHKDHGDTDGACGMTTPNAVFSPNKIITTVNRKQVSSF